jgi:hypothetical protein
VKGNWKREKGKGSPKALGKVWGQVSRIEGGNKIVAELILWAAFQDVLSDAYDYMGAKGSRLLRSA